MDGLWIVSPDGREERGGWLGWRRFVSDIVYIKIEYLIYFIQYSTSGESANLGFLPYDNGGVRINAWRGN